MKSIERCKPYTMPETCTDAALVRCYAHDVARHQALLTGLRRPDGALYLPKSESKARVKRVQKSTRKAA